MLLTPLDITIVIIYLIATVAIGLYAGRGNEDTEDYFIAGRNIPQWAVGMTLMATLISSNTLVAHPGIVFQKGMVLVPGFVALPLVLIFVARYIVPFYRRIVGMSAYEFIGRRFGMGGRTYASLGFLFERTFDVGVTLLTTALAISLMTGVDLPAIIFVIAIATLIYTAIGGLAAVVWTDVVQGVILIGGGVIILLRLLFAPEAGPPFAVIHAAWEGGRFSFGSTDTSLASLSDPNQRTVWMFMMAMAVQWSRRFICDQHMVQRYLIARSDEEARKGTLIGAWLSIPILIAFNLIGACLFGFYTLTGSELPEFGDQILPHFIVNYLPAGLVGVMLAAIIAASMSSMSSDLNSIATVLTKDYLQRFLPTTSQRNQLRFGRATVVIIGLIGALIGIALIPRGDVAPIAERALVIAVIVSAGSLGLFALGALTRTATREGAYAGIAACVIFTAWAVATEPGSRFIDMSSLNFGLNAILIGVLGHVVIFAVGYAVSALFGGYRPEEVAELQLFRGK